MSYRRNKVNRKRLLDLYRYHDHFVTRTAHIDTYSLYVINETSSLLMGHFILIAISKSTQWKKWDLAKKQLIEF